MIRISHPTKSVKGIITLPSSKSISNRVLMLQKMYEPDLVIDNLSEANDTKLLKDLLSNDDKSLNVQDAGTAYRFLLAYCSITPGEWTITGTSRLQERPIDRLVDSLRQLGAEMRYLEREGFAPLLINGKKLKTSARILDLSNVESSQFISALLMILPAIEGNVKVKINPNMNSKTFVNLTISVMRKMGFSIVVKKDIIEIKEGRRFKSEYFKIEPDWNSFYYFYSISHLASEVDLCFEGLSMNNMHQEKKRLFDVGNHSLKFGEDAKGLCVQKSVKNQFEYKQELDYSQFPDLAPTFIMLYAAFNVNEISFTGLESLKFKECDREKVVKKYISESGAVFNKEGLKWTLNADKFHVEEDQIFATYDDHRMAMSLAPLAMIKPIQIENEGVVKKSYPHFWEDLAKLGFQIEYL